MWNIGYLSGFPGAFSEGLNSLLFIAQPISSSRVFILHHFPY